MPSAKNISLVAQLESQLAKAKALILADYRGLSVADIQNLRAQVRASGGSLTVAKNTLLKIALKHQDLEPALQGPTALILSLGDAIAPIKVLVEFARGHALNIPTPKAGLLDDRVLTEQDIKSLAALPSRDQLIAQLLRQLQAPLYGLANVLQGNLRNLVYAIDAIRNEEVEPKKYEFLKEKLPISHFMSGLYFWMMMRERGFSHATTAHGVGNFTGMMTMRISDKLSSEKL